MHLPTLGFQQVNNGSGQQYFLQVFGCFQAFGSRGSCGHGSELSHLDMDRRFYSMFPFTRVPFWVPIFDPERKAPHLDFCSTQDGSGRSRERRCRFPSIPPLGWCLEGSRSFWSCRWESLGFGSFWEFLGEPLGAFGRLWEPLGVLVRDNW